MSNFPGVVQNKQEDNMISFIQSFCLPSVTCIIIIIIIHETNHSCLLPFYTEFWKLIKSKIPEKPKKIIICIEHI